MIHESLLNNLIPNVEVYLRLVRFSVIFILGLIVTRVVVVPVTRRVLRRRGAGTESSHSILNVASVIGYFLSFTIALQAGNFGNLMTIMGAMAAALTVAIGFGMRDQISNLVAGFLIYIYNPYKIGDYIKSQTAEGVVESIHLASTTLTGSSSQKIVVPNGQITTEELKNYTRDSRTKASIRMTLPIEHLEAGTELLAEIANAHSEVLDDPEPDIFYSETDGEMYAELHYWLENSRDSKQIKSDILEDFTRRMQDAGLAKPDDIDEGDG